MAQRQIRVDDDEILRKASKNVDKVDDRIRQLIDDMKETMYTSDGVGLAAVQIGVLKRIVVIDVGEGPIVLINPEILSSSGKRIDTEGCLSVTEYVGKVERPAKLKVKALDEEFKKVEYCARELFARAVCHELDHLDGVLFTDRAQEIINKKDLKENSD
jgi:peptide deformylase